METLTFVNDTLYMNIKVTVTELVVTGNTEANGRYDLDAMSDLKLYIKEQGLKTVASHERMTRYKKTKPSLYKSKGFSSGRYEQFSDF